MNVFFVGLGAMGSRMANRLAEKGFEVTGYNRSPKNDLPFPVTQDLADIGKADVVISMLSDDQASLDVWHSQKGLAFLKPGCYLVSCGTHTPKHSQFLDEACEAGGLVYVEAPVVGSLQHVEQGQLCFLLSCSQDFPEEINRICAVLGPKSIKCGSVGQALRLKLAVNMLLSVQMVQLSEALKMVPDDLVAAFLEMPVISAVMKAMAPLIQKNEHRPLFPLSLARKDLDYFVLQNQASLAAYTPDLFTKAEGQGLGELNLTAIARLNP